MTSQRKGNSKLCAIFHFVSVKLDSEAYRLNVYVLNVTGPR